MTTNPAGSPGHTHRVREFLLPLRSRIGVASAGVVLALGGCGGGAAFSPPPTVVSVSLYNTTIVVAPGGTAVNVAVNIVAPTETATLTINGLPAGVAESFKESESNPSGLLTLSANSTTMPGTYMPMITVSSSGQIASVGFTLVVSAPPKQAFEMDEPLPHRVLTATES